MTNQNTNQPQPQPQPQYIYVGSNPQDTMRAIAATRSYVGPAIWTLVLYYLLFYIGGLIANIAYLSSANNTERITGIAPEGKGCLWALLIVHFIVPVVLIIFLVIMGGLAVLID